MGRSVKGPGSVSREKRRTEAAELRAKGANYDEIAKRLGVSIATVSRDLGDRIELWRTQSVDAMDVYRESEADEMRKVRKRAWDAIEEVAPDKIAPLLGQVVKAGERTAKLFGLDAPERIELAGRLDVMSDDEALDVLEKTAALGDWRDT